MLTDHQYRQVRTSSSERDEHRVQLVLRNGKMEYTWAMRAQLVMWQLLHARDSLIGQGRRWCTCCPVFRVQTLPSMMKI